VRILHGFDRIFRGKSSHNEGQLAVRGGLDRKTVNALNILGSVRTAAVYFHNKLDVFHVPPELPTEWTRQRSPSSLELSQVPTAALIGLGLESKRSPADRAVSNLHSSEQAQKETVSDGYNRGTNRVRTSNLLNNNSKLDSRGCQALSIDKLFGRWPLATAGVLSIQATARNCDVIA
jgi:hypothetical protein